MAEQNVMFESDWVSPAGDSILDLIEERDWSQAELALRLGMSAKHLNRLIKGKAALSYDTALKLERVLGSTSSFWMNREIRYQEQLARLDAQQQFDLWSDWLELLPVSALRKMGVIEQSNADKAGLVETLLAFFGVASPQEWQQHYLSMDVCFRRTNEGQADTGAIASWLRLGELEAEKMTIPKYNRSKFERAVKVIRSLTTESPDTFLPILKEHCNAAGVKLVLVKSIPGTHVSGVARWLNGHSPLIQLSLYGKKNDKFWFTFFHEAAHILLHADGKQNIFLDDIEFNDTAKEEREANAFARELLIPEIHRYELASLRYEEEINYFANKLGIHPGIVVGRLQYDGQLSYKSTLNRLKESFDVDRFMPPAHD